MFANNFHSLNKKFTAPDNYEFQNFYIVPHHLARWRESSADEQLTILDATSKTQEVA